VERRLPSRRRRALQRRSLRNRSEHGRAPRRIADLDMRCRALALQRREKEVGMCRVRVAVRNGGHARESGARNSVSASPRPAARVGHGRTRRRSLALPPASASEVEVRGARASAEPLGRQSGAGSEGLGTAAPGAVDRSGKGIGFPREFRLPSTARVAVGPLAGEPSSPSRALGGQRLARPDRIGWGRARSAAATDEAGSAARRRATGRLRQSGPGSSERPGSPVRAPGGRGAQGEVPTRPRRSMTARSSTGRALGGTFAIAPWPSATRATGVGSLPPGSGGGPAGRSAAGPRCSPSSGRDGRCRARRTGPRRRHGSSSRWSGAGDDRPGANSGSGERGRRSAAAGGRGSPSPSCRRDVERPCSGDGHRCRRTRPAARRRTARVPGTLRAGTTPSSRMRTRGGRLVRFDLVDPVPRPDAGLPVVVHDPLVGGPRRAPWSRAAVIHGEERVATGEARSERDSLEGRT